VTARRTPESAALALAAATILAPHVARADDASAAPATQGPDPHEIALELPSVKLKFRARTAQRFIVVPTGRGDDEVRRTEPVSPAASVLFTRRADVTCKDMVGEAKASAKRPSFVPSLYDPSVLRRDRIGEVVACLELRSGVLIARIVCEDAVSADGWTAMTPVLEAAAREALIADGDDPSRHVAEHQKERRTTYGWQWYGYQIVPADAAAAIVMVNAYNQGRPGAFLAGYGIYLVGGPIVHGLHDNAAAFSSLGLRLVCPLAGLLVGAAVALGSLGRADDSDPYRVTGFGIFVAGLIAPAVIDYTLLGVSRVRVDAPPRASLSVAPAFGAVSDADRHIVPTFGVALRSF